MKAVTSDPSAGAAPQLQALRQALAAERAARARAEQALARKDEFIAIVSHELRAPLGAILGWAHQLRRRSGEEDFERGLEVIEQSVQAQSRLIDDLLDMSRIASGTLRLDVEVLDARDVVRAAVDAARPGAQDKRIALHLDTPSQPVRVRADPMRLQQVVGNLLGNAVKFTPEGGVIDVRMGERHGGAEITVRDSGAGISAAFLPHVFERYRQDPDTSRGHGGLGLGLAIAQQLVQLHGGEIVADSEGEGRGATFTVRLPLAGSASQSAQSGTQLQNRLRSP